MLEARLWVTKNNKNYLGRGRIALLENIRQTGSIHAAAKMMKMSYKAAWDSVDAMNNLSHTPLVVRTSGGKGGGGTRLTPRAEEIIASFHKLETKHQQFLDLFAVDFDSLESTLALLDHLPLKLSARNQLMGSITSLQADAVSVMVELTIKNSEKLYANITLPSFESLGVHIHDRAIAIIKASSVFMHSEAPASLEYENIFEGVVSHCITGQKNTEITLELPSYTTLTATIENNRAEELGLVVGQKAYAFFKASSVILGV